MKINENIMQLQAPNMKEMQKLGKAYMPLPSAADEALSNTKKTFDQYIMEAFSQMNNQQMEVSELSQTLMTDPDSVDIHDVTTAMAKAQMSMTLAKTVIDRVVTGWNEITTTR